MAPTLPAFLVPATSVASSDGIFRFLARSARGFTLMYARGMYDGSDIGGVRGDDADVFKAARLYGCGASGPMNGHNGPMNGQMNGPMDPTGWLVNEAEAPPPSPCSPSPYPRE